MFKFLKDKLKSAISKISEGVEKEGKAEETAAEPAASKEEKGFFAKLKEKFVGKEEENVIEEKKEIIGEKITEIETRKEIRQHVGNKEEETPKVFEHEEKIRKKPKAEAKTEKIKKEIPAGKEKDAKKAEQDIETKEKVQPADEAEPKALEEPGKKGFFASLTERIITTKIDEGQFEKLFWDLELALMENNVAIEVIEKIKKDLKEELVEKPIRRTRVEETIAETLRNSIEDLFEKSGFDLAAEIKNKKDKPYVIAFFGINGSGKTTSIAKLANMLKEKGITCVLAAGDTFRAASIEQLQLHADKVGVKLIKHTYGSDPAAVAFDAVKHAKSKNIDAVLIDTAGRMHSNESLLAEMKKIIRVAKPDLRIFVGESITGNDCVEQAKTFNEAVGIDGIILAKADIDEKGGAAVSVSYVTKKPILYLGVGQDYKDLQKFEPEVIVKGLGLS
ncbi:signal recognition particle-docking protein FtsY [Candidatus Woesearchaeota archaeon]|nr:signal recognition particle-docking protein FtsY [Candidatus Woesearchaeota archaeon]